MPNVKTVVLLGSVTDNVGELVPQMDRDKLGKLKILIENTFHVTRVYITIGPRMTGEKSLKKSWISLKVIIIKSVNVHKIINTEIRMP